MLTTYDRIMKQHRIRLTTLQVKQLEDKLARADEPGVGDELTVPGVTLAQVMREAAKTAAIVFFSLAFITGCTSAYTYTSERCPAPLSAKGCYAYLQPVSPWTEHVTPTIEQVWRY